MSKNPESNSKSSSKSSSKASSLKSQDDATLASSAALTSQDKSDATTTTLNGSQSSVDAPKPTEKASVKDRLTRMFSTNNKSPTKLQLESFTRPRGSSLISPNPSRNNTASPVPRKTSSFEKEDPAKQSTASLASNTGASSKAPRSPGRDQPRFTLNPEVTGGHEHYLRSLRRQDKLSDKFKFLLGKKVEVEVGDLSLVSDWVDTLKRETDEAVDKKGGPNDTKSLVEKYGKCQEVVGRGAFGIVRISHKKQENGERLFAVKEFRRRPEETEKRYSKRLLAEYNIGASLLHPNVCRTLDLVKDDKGDLCEVMEYCAGGDLYSLVLASGMLEVQEADCFFKQLMRGVQYLHEMGVAHRDLKPENLLLTKRGALKITDFGNGECFRYAWETEPHMVSGVCGSAPYIAPEEYTDKEFDGRAVDVWACGVIYMAMRTGRHLWNVAREDEDEFYGNYLRGRKREDGYQPIESLRRIRCRNVIYSVLDPSAPRRLTASQVLKSEWVRDIKLCRAGEEGV